MADHGAPHVSGEVNDDVRKQQVIELGQVREDLSKIMAEDAKDFQGPRLAGSSHLRMTTERIDRSAKRTELQHREDRLMQGLREQTGGPIDGLV